MNAGEMKQPPCAVDLRRTTSYHCARLARIWWKRFSEKLKQTAELRKALNLVNLLGLDVEFRKRDQSGCRKPVEGNDDGNS